MMQTFLPAFEAVVVDSKIRGIMCAYNSVNGVPLCANELLQKQLRERMGFEGIVITDCGAIGMMTGNHHWNHSNGTAYTPVEATAAAMAAGTDLNCGSAYGADLREAWAAKMVTIEMLKQAAGRAVYGWLELGLFQDTAAAALDARRQVPMSAVDSAPHRALAREAAVQGEQHPTLPKLSSPLWCSHSRFALQGWCSSRIQRECCRLAAAAWRPARRFPRLLARRNWRCSARTPTGR